jgi:hypothetical protein
VERDRAYLYAIIADEVEIDLGPTGGLDGSGPVAGLSVEGLTAVAAPYAGLPIERLSRPEVLRALIAHQEVIERIIADRSVLPVKFGTILDSAGDVRRALTIFRPRLESAFADVSGAVEIDLSATWDLAVMFDEIKEESDIAALAGAGDESDGGVSLATRIQAGKMVHEALERCREEYRHHAVEALAPLVRDMRRNPLPADDIVLNLALLVERPRLAEVDEGIDRLAAESSGRVTFRYVGPLPPYSFATVVLSTLEPSQIASAAEMLGLRTRATRAEIRAAYRTLAADYHPDRNPRDPASHERFAALGAAYRLLTRYLEGQRTGRERQDASAMYDLSPDRAGQTLLLEIAEDDSSVGFRSEVWHG